MKHLRQHRNTNCGQTCVAIITGLDIGEAERVFKSHAGTRTIQMHNALKELGYDSNKKLTRCRLGWDYNFPDLCLVKMTWVKGRGSHWIVCNNGKVYDPSEVSEHSFDHYRSHIEGHMRPTSFLEITKRVSK